MNTVLRRICTMICSLGFLLGIHNGRVALWREGEPRPYQIYDIPASQLPPEVRTRLQEGIFVESRADVLFFLENFL